MRGGVGQNPATHPWYRGFHANPVPNRMREVKSAKKLATGGKWELTLSCGHVKVRAVRTKRVPKSSKCEVCVA